MTVPAIITAELLVHPAIRYPVTAMKTFRHMPDYFLIVFHPLDFLSNMRTRNLASNIREAVFLFL